MAQKSGALAALIENLCLDPQAPHQVAHSHLMFQPQGLQYTLLPLRTLIGTCTHPPTHSHTLIRKKERKKEGRKKERKKEGRKEGRKERKKEGRGLLRNSCCNVFYNDSSVHRNDICDTVPSNDITQ